MHVEIVTALVKVNAMNEFPRHFPAHEVPVQQLIRGEGNVRVCEVPDYPVKAGVICDDNGKPVDFDSDDVYTELLNKYPPAKEGMRSPVERVFVSPRSLEKFYEKRDSSEEVAGTQSTTGGYQPTKDEELKTAPPEDSESAGDKKEHRKQIIARLEELEVPFSPKTPTAHLEKLLETVEEKEPAE